jgi:hypothetical protein
MGRVTGDSLAKSVPAPEKQLTQAGVESIFPDPFAASISCIHAVDLSKPPG